MATTSDDDHAATRPAPDGRRLVVRSGQPTAQELAALVAAVDAIATAPDDAAVASPAWLAAARLEGVGTGQLATPADLAHPERGGWAHRP